MVVRRLRETEAEAWREVRLRALADAPDAFETTYEEALGRDPGFWLERTRTLAEGITSVMFVAEEGDRVSGIAGGFVAPDEPDAPHLISMWVAPEARRRGLGRLLAEAVAGWARDRGSTALRLFVIEGNGAAAALYASLGFTDTGVRIPMSRKPELIEVEMRLPLQ